MIVLSHALHIVHDPAVLRLVDAVVQLPFYGNIVLDEIEIILADRSVAGSADIQVEAGVFRRTAREKPPENQPGPLGDQGGRKNHGDGGHQHTHGGQLGCQGTKHQQALSPVLPGGPPIKEGGYNGGKEKAEQERNDASRPGDAQNGASRHQQTGSGHTQHNGEREHPAAHSSRLNDHALVGTVNINQVVDIRPADIFAAAAKGKEIDQGKIEDRQPQGGEGKAERESVGQAEQR